MTYHSDNDEMRIAELIREDEGLARLRETHCPHFVRGGEDGNCTVCSAKPEMDKLEAKMAEIQDAIDAEFEANGYSARFNALQEDYSEVLGNYMELALDI